MYTAYGIRHRKLAFRVIAYKGIETRTLHIGGKNDFGFGKLVGIDFQKTDMISVYGSVEKIEIIAVNNKIGARLTVLYKYRGFPLTRI